MKNVPGTRFTLVVLVVLLAVALTAARYLDNGVLAETRVDAARAGLESNQLKDVFHAMHSLKSSAAMLGATHLTQIAERIERLATDESAEPLGRQIDDLATELARVETLLQENRRGRSA